MGMQGCISEYRFDPKRRWRCDYYFPVGLAIELEGGLWASTQGRKSRHFHGTGAKNDMIKYNALTEKHIFLLRFEPSKIDYNQILKVYNSLKNRS